MAPTTRPAGRGGASRDPRAEVLRGHLQLSRSRPGVSRGGRGPAGRVLDCRALMSSGRAAAGGSAQRASPRGRPGRVLGLGGARRAPAGVAPPPHRRSEVDLGPTALEQSDRFAFYAVRDFELDAPPERAPSTCSPTRPTSCTQRAAGGLRRLLRARAARHLPPRRALRPGWNRLAVELRSGRGAGGLLSPCSPTASAPCRERRAGGSSATRREWSTARARSPTASRRWCGSRRRTAVGACRGSAPSGRPSMTPWPCARGRLDPPLLEPRTEPPPPRRGRRAAVNDFGDAVRVPGAPRSRRGAATLGSDRARARQEASRSTSCSPTARPSGRRGVLDVALRRSPDLPEGAPPSSRCCRRSRPRTPNAPSSGVEGCSGSSHRPDGH